MTRTNNKSRNKKRKLSQRSDAIVVPVKREHLDDPPPVEVSVKQVDSDDPSSETESETENLDELLEVYSKNQLIEFICDAAVKDSSLMKSIRNTADRDVSHRKIYVYGFGWDATSEMLTAVFESFGEIEDCHVVVDKATGRAKGFGFILYKTREGAVKALKQPQKCVKNRTVWCQLASLGSVPVHQNQDTTGRKIYVSNVPEDVDSVKLLAFFEKFGDIELGPLGFDVATGKSRGFALFVYKTQEGAKKVLEEPHKMFEGHLLHCKMANVTVNKNKPAVQPPTQGPVLAAAEAANNLAYFSQHPAYSGLPRNPNPGLVAGSVNPWVAGSMHPGVVPSSQVPGSSLPSAAGFGGYGAPHGFGSVGGNPSVPGLYGSSGPSLQAPQSYQTSHYELPSVARAYGMGGPLTGYPSYFR